MTGECTSRRVLRVDPSVYVSEADRVLTFLQGCRHIEKGEVRFLFVHHFTMDLSNICVVSL